MKFFKNVCKIAAILCLSFSLPSCDSSNTSVYGSIGASSGYSNYNNYYRGGYNSGPRMRGSITIGGRIR